MKFKRVLRNILCRDLALSRGVLIFSKTEATQAKLTMHASEQVCATNQYTYH